MADQFIDMHATPGAIYGVLLAAATRQHAAAAFAGGDHPTTNQASPFERPGLAIRSCGGTQGSFKLDLSDRRGAVHHFRGTYFDVHPWLPRLATGVM